MGYIEVTDNLTYTKADIIHTLSLGHIYRGYNTEECQWCTIFVSLNNVDSLVEIYDTGDVNIRTEGVPEQVKVLKRISYEVQLIIGG